MGNLLVDMGIFPYPPGYVPPNAIIRPVVQLGCLCLPVFPVAPDSELFPFFHISIMSFMFHKQFHKQLALRLPAILLLALVLGACGVKPQMTEEDGGIDFGRNSEFQGPWLRVYLDLEDGREVSVNTEDDAVSTGTEPSPLPGHQARYWRFVQQEPEGTSYVYALVSWNGDDPADYLMAGWWAHFDGEQPPDLTYGNLYEYSILDGPELDPEAPPELPVAGTASYAGPAGGVYVYVPGETLEERHFVVDGWEATATLSADFGSGMMSGCVGCVGDFITRTAVIPASRGDVQADISDYELHLAAHPWREDGTFDGAMAEVLHPSREIVGSEGEWGASLSSRADADGNPRLIAGFAGADFEEADGSVGGFFGSFVGLSETFLNPEPGSP